MPFSVVLVKFLVFLVQSKGLEWDVVFIIKVIENCIEGRFFWTLLCCSHASGGSCFDFL